MPIGRTKKTWDEALDREPICKWHDRKVPHNWATWRAVIKWLRQTHVRMESAFQDNDIDNDCCLTSLLARDVFAPKTRRVWTITGEVARWSGVFPLLSRTLTSAPQLNSAMTHGSLFFSTCDATKRSYRARGIKFCKTLSNKLKCSIYTSVFSIWENIWQFQSVQLYEW